MKQLKKIFTLTLLLFTINIHFTSAQSLESRMRGFFSYNNNAAYEMVSKLVHFTNTFNSGSLYMSGNNIYVTINSTGYFGGGPYNTKVIIHKDGSRFDSIDLISDDDICAFCAAKLAKAFFNSAFRDDHYELISWAEEMYGRRLYDMSAQEIGLALLSVMLWEYPY